MSSNSKSMVFYQMLIDDTEAEITYFRGHPELPKQQEMLDNFSKLLEMHRSNMVRLRNQADNRNEDILTEIANVIDDIEEMILVFGNTLPSEVKSWLTKLINAAKKLLKILTKPT